MDTPTSSKPAATEKNGHAAGQVWSPNAGYLMIALLLAAGGLSFLFYLLMSSSIPDDAANASSANSTSSTSSGASLPAPVESRLSTQSKPPASPLPQIAAPAVEGDADPTRDLKYYVARGEKPTMPEVIARLHEAGVHSGLGAFSPPGTRPALIGLAVPEDFVLPKGYVRHHQATDDGQRIEAILMFAPDYQLFDAANKPIPLPKDRVVPPELAPPGLPNRRIVLPAPVEANK
ncbi:MAG: hypothetical protein NTY70_11165 [Burkholderiales bacterium]|nr:hypothetical protein [Burkholderiales bacterium]